MSRQAGVRSILIGTVQWQVCLRRVLHYLLVLHLVTGLQTQEVESERGPLSKGHVEKVFQVVGITKDQRWPVESMASYFLNVFTRVFHSLQLGKRKKSHPYHLLPVLASVEGMIEIRFTVS